MPLYDYRCPKCEVIEEQCHSIHKDPDFECPECQTRMNRLIGMGAYVATGLKPTLADSREVEYTKKVKDPERAVRSRQKEFGHDAVGDPSMQTDPRHVIKRGRTLGGQQKEIDKAEFIKAAAKDDHVVDQCVKSLKSKD